MLSINKFSAKRETRHQRLAGGEWVGITEEYLGFLVRTSMKETKSVPLVSPPPARVMLVLRQELL